MKTEASTPSSQPTPGERALLLRILDEGYHKRAWHGPNLRGSIRGLSADAAAWRPHPSRHSIAEMVVHCAYWKYAARRRLRGDKRGSFSLKGSNWFAIASPLSELSWKQHIALLEEEHRSLRAVVASFPIEQLHRLPEGSTVSVSSLISGVAAHDVYHAGQIQLLKRLRADPV